MLKNLISRQKVNRVVLPTYTVINPPTALSLCCYQASFFDNEGFIKVRKKGCIYTEIIPMIKIEEQQRNGSQKQSHLQTARYPHGLDYVAPARQCIKKCYTFPFIGFYGWHEKEHLRKNEKNDKTKNTQAVMISNSDLLVIQQQFQYAMPFVTGLFSVAFPHLVLDNIQEPRFMTKKKTKEGNPFDEF